MTAWPKLSEETRKSRLTFPQGILPMVLDTDTYNEVDDQFALCYSLLSPQRLRVEAIYAAPFLNERSKSAGDGMEQSYQEICRLLRLLNHNPEGFVFRGVTDFMPSVDTPVDCPAVRDLIARAMARPDGDPLYVVAIGAPTNIASALVMEPRLVEKIVVIWLGGHALYWRDTREFNLKQDLASVRVLLDSGVPLVLVPCMGVASHTVTSVHELRACIGGKNALCDALVELVQGYAPDHMGYSKPLWDVAAIGILIKDGWAAYSWQESPLITENVQWAKGEGRHTIRVVEEVDRNAMFRDMFKKLSSLPKA